MNISGVNAALQNRPDAISANRDGFGSRNSKILDHPQICIHILTYEEVSKKTLTTGGSSTNLDAVLHVDVMVPNRVYFSII